MAKRLSAVFASHCDRETRGADTPLRMLFCVSLVQRSPKVRGGLHAVDDGEHLDEFPDAFGDDAVHFADGKIVFLSPTLSTVRRMRPGSYRLTEMSEGRRRAFCPSDLCAIFSLVETILQRDQRSRRARDKA